MYNLKINIYTILYILMSYYTSQIESVVIDPVFNQSKYRSEFRLEENMLYSNFLRVLNLGVVGTEGTFDNSRRYHLLSGVGGIIKNIFLYDGKEVLDQILNYRDYGAFKNYNTSNSDNMDVKKNLKKHGLGFVYHTTEFTPATLNFRSKITEFNPQVGGHIPSTSDSSTPTGYLDLRDVFPLLKSLEFLPTSIFKNLRVVIEYQVDTAALTKSDSNSSAPSSSTIPVLVCDKIVDDSFVSKWMSDFKNVSWNCVENENVFLPASTSSQQTIKYRLNGFNNKTLTTLLLQKKASDDDTYRTNGSRAFDNENIQVYVNGSAILPDNGVSNYNHKLGMLTETFGNCNSYTGCNLPYVININDNYTSDVDFGVLDYFGCIIGKKINSLDVSISRSCGATIDPTSKSAITLQFWGSVQKVLIVNKDKSYQILYV